MDQRLYQQLIRGCEEIIREEELKKLFDSDKSPRVYLGIDPTSPKIHLGHAVVLNKLKIFQQLGAKVILLIGDFTATIGDPSGRDTQREVLTSKQIKENTKTYLDQASKIIPIGLPDNPVEVRYNSEWHSSENKKDLFVHLRQLTVQQMLERDLFEQRIKKNLPLSLSEFLYPYLQGYDAVMLDADVQIGGNDQKFNMLMGRDLRKKLQQKNHIVITTPLLIGTDGRKMSKSYSNSINLDDDAKDMFGKIMSIDDSQITNYYSLLTNVSSEAIAQIKNELKTENPRTIKFNLAKIVTETIHGQISADAAATHFEDVFSKKQIPKDIKSETIEKGEGIIDTLLKTGLAPSKAQAHRLIDQKGIKFNRKSVENSDFKIESDGTLQVGKRNFIKIIVK